MPNTAIPKEKPSKTTLLSPFDPLVWFRPRTERLWDFHYRIEIYTPEPKRVYGYYTLPILWNGQIAGRIDLKNDRQNKTLLVQSAWHEPNIDPAALANDLGKHLAQTAKWQNCKDIELKKKGNLSAALSKTIG
ncbi:MAG: DNA glycosylase AlkZ-like family protein [Micrococcales bacterium]